MSTLHPFIACCLAAALAATAPLAQAQSARKEREAQADPSQLTEVGEGQAVARQGLAPGAYIASRHRAAVAAWLRKHHGPGRPCLPSLRPDGAACRPPEGSPRWVIGEALPAQAATADLPAGLQAALPAAPPGNRYVLVGGDILLLASRSRLVVDAVPYPR